MSAGFFLQEYGKHDKLFSYQLSNGQTRYIRFGDNPGNYNWLSTFGLYSILTTDRSSSSASSGNSELKLAEKLHL